MVARSMCVCLSPVLVRANCCLTSTPSQLKVSCNSQSHPLTKTLSDIQKSGLIACLRAPSAELALGAARAAINGGIKVDILADVQGSEVLYIPGVMTPTEILSAHNAGAKIVKIYPISSLGGVDYISALKKPFHHIPMVASQGVKIGQVGEYIARGASAVVLSDAIFDKEAVVNGEFDLISKQAQLAASVAEEAIKRLNPNPFQVKHEHL